MSDTPVLGYFGAAGTICAGSPSCPVSEALATIGGSTITSATWPTANMALVEPVYLDDFAIIYQLFCENGSAVSGNVDVGIYDESGLKVVSAGSTAQAGTSVLQVFNVTDTPVAPGTYFKLLTLDNTTGTFNRSSIDQVILRSVGFMQLASAFPLPSSINVASLAAPAQAYYPNWGAVLNPNF